MDAMAALRAVSGGSGGPPPGRAGRRGCEPAPGQRRQRGRPPRRAQRRGAERRSIFRRQIADFSETLLRRGAPATDARHPRTPPRRSGF